MAQPRRTFAVPLALDDDDEGSSRRGNTSAQEAQLRALATEGDTSSSRDGLVISVRGHSLASIVQLLAAAVVQQQHDVLAASAAAQKGLYEVQASLAQVSATVETISEDVGLQRRLPFSLVGGTSSPTLADAVRYIHDEVVATRQASRRATAASLAATLRLRQLAKIFCPWLRRVRIRRVAAAAAAKATQDTLIVYYDRWRRFTLQLRRRHRARARHERAVAHRTCTALLRVYFVRWTSLAHESRAAVCRLRAYQERVALAWSVSGSATTALRGDFFARWRRWAQSNTDPPAPPAMTASDRVPPAVGEIVAAPPPAEVAELAALQQRVLHSAFAVWRDMVQRRHVARLYLRLARVLAAQNASITLRARFHTWAAVAQHVCRRNRLELLAADAHKRRVTALARRYFHALRYHRREQQFQRMMHRVESSVLMLCSRMRDVEQAVLERSPTEAPQRLLTVPAAARTPRRATSEGTRVRCEQAWTPRSEEEDLLRRVEDLLSRPHTRYDG
ncbi:hypothetical protein NESM_000502100 [Novymonas esmeraldas]|uniref:Uncharacterized protein n=1 Tax=Novymonas esmeraldas TaxID=1808958 RepID=A0AAW0ENF2_9TRYP